MEDYLVAHCNIDLLFVLSGHNIEMSLKLLLQSGYINTDHLFQYYCKHYALYSGTFYKKEADRLNA